MSQFQRSPTSGFEHPMSHTVNKQQTDAQAHNDIDEILATWSGKKNEDARLKVIRDAQATRLQNLYDVRDAIWADEPARVSAALSEARNSDDKALAAAIEGLILERRDYDTSNRILLGSLGRAALWSLPLIVMIGLFGFFGLPTFFSHDPASFVIRGFWFYGLAIAGVFSAILMWAAFNSSVPWGRSLQLAPCDQLQSDGGEA